MTNITTYQQLRANVQQINLIKAVNHTLLSKLVSSDEFLDLLNDTRLSAEPIETYVIDNNVQIKYIYKELGFKVILTDKEIDDNLNGIHKTATKIMEKLENDKK